MFLRYVGFIVFVCAGVVQAADQVFDESHPFNLLLINPRVAVDHESVCALAKVNTWLNKRVIETKFLRSALFDFVNKVPNILCDQCSCKKRAVYGNKYGSLLIYLTKTDISKQLLFLEKLTFSQTYFIHLNWAYVENGQLKKYSIKMPEIQAGLQNKPDSCERVFYLFSNFELVSVEGPTLKDEKNIVFDYTYPQNWFLKTSQRKRHVFNLSGELSIENLNGFYNSNF